MNIHPLIVEHILKTLEVYQSLFSLSKPSNSVEQSSPFQILLSNFVINAIDINVSIQKSNEQSSTNSPIVKLLSGIGEMNIGHILIEIPKYIYPERHYTFETFKQQFIEHIKMELGDLKWIVIGKLIGLKTMSTSYKNYCQYNSEEYRLVEMKELNEETKQTISLFQGREYKSKLKQHSTEGTKKNLPNLMIHQQQHQMTSSIKNSFKELGSSVFDGLKGFWSSSHGMKEIASSRKKQYTSAGFVGGATLGAIGTVMRPIDGFLGFFKTIGEGMDGFTFGQIAIQRMRPPRMYYRKILRFNWEELYRINVMKETMRKADGYIEKHMMLLHWNERYYDNSMIILMITNREIVFLKKITSDDIDDYKIIRRIPILKIENVYCEKNCICFHMIDKNRSVFDPLIIKVKEWNNESIEGIIGIVKGLQKEYAEKCKALKK